MDSTNSSERHQNNNLKVILSYVDFIGKDISLSSIDKIDSIIFFLKTKKKAKIMVLTKMDFYIESLSSKN